MWGEWQKQMMDALIRYMPTFSLNELLRCAAVSFPRVPSVMVERLHERWGGSARLVLALADPNA